MSFGSWIDERIANVLAVLGVEKRLDQLQVDAKAEIDALRADAKQELEELRDKAFQEFEETRDKALAMFKDSLPEMAGEVSRAAVTAVFDHTQIDETTDHVTDVFNKVLNGLPFGLGR